MNEFCVFVIQLEHHQVGGQDENFAVDVLQSGGVTVKQIEMDPSLFGIPETRRRNMFPFYRAMSDAEWGKNIAALNAVADLVPGQHGSA